MPLNEMKKKLISCIKSTNDEELLSLMKEDFVFYSKIKEVDIIDKLIQKQFAELKALSEEDKRKDTMTLDEFKEATEQWRINISS